VTRANALLPDQAGEATPFRDERSCRGPGDYINYMYNIIKT